MSLVMRLNEEIASDLNSGGRRFGIIIDRVGDDDDGFDFADDWCRDYALGIAMREDEWKDAMDVPELREALLPILTIARFEKPNPIGRASANISSHARSVARIRR